MTAGVPRHKGTGFIALIKTLNVYPGGKEAVPTHLKHYLDGHVLPSGWYPEDDLNTLVQVLADLVSGGLNTNVWLFFGKTAAQRDLAGEQNLVSHENRVETAGYYRHFAGTEGMSISALFGRLTKLWAVYHDTGTMTCGRSRSNPRVVVVRVTDFKFPYRGQVEVQLGYTCEYARLVGFDIRGEITRSSADGDAFNEWEYTASPQSEILASIALLPLLPGL